MCALRHYFRMVEAKTQKRLHKHGKGSFLRQKGHVGEVRGIEEEHGCATLDLFLDLDLELEKLKRQEGLGSGYWD